MGNRQICKRNSGNKDKPIFNQILVFFIKLLQSKNYLYLTHEDYIDSTKLQLVKMKKIK